MSWYLNVDKGTDKQIPRLDRQELTGLMAPYLQWAKAQLAEYKEPTRVVFVDHGLWVEREVK